MVAQLTPDQIKPIVHRFGGKERFAIHTLPWYEGEFGYFCEIVELWVNKDRRAEVAPYLFGHIMSQFWARGAVHTSDTMGAQVVSCNKVRIQLSHIGKKEFLEASVKGAQ